MKRQKMKRLFVDQFGQKIYASTIKELKQKAGPGKVSRMFIDGTDGKIYHVGYVIGARWFSFYEPIMKEA